LDTCCATEKCILNSINRNTTLSKPLRIFVDMHVFDGTLQGTTTYLKGLYTELIKDQSIQFFLAARKVDRLKLIFGEHSNVTYLQYPRQNKFSRLFFTIPQLIQKNQIDYAHFQYVVPPIKKCAYINTIHDVLFLDFPRYFPISYRLKNYLLFKFSAQLSEVVLTVSEFSKRQLQHHFGLPAVGLTPNAVDPVFFEPYDKINTQQAVLQKYGAANYWLYVSRWEPRKNHDFLLKAFVEGGFYADHHLVFVGDPALPNQAYDKYFARLSPQIQQKIIPLTKVDFQDLLLLVRGATLSVYPSVAEGFGIPPLESIAASVPTLCSNTTAMADFDFIGSNLFHPLRVEEFIEKAKTALTHPFDTTQKEHVAQRYSWALAAQNFKQALQK